MEIKNVSVFAKPQAALKINLKVKIKGLKCNVFIRELLAVCYMREENCFSWILEVARKKSTL